MTDKQIIIDGINIEHCAFYRADGMCNREMLLNQPFDTCERGRKTCYYMQLKRKEQECEELKKIINEAKNSKLDLKSFLVGEAVQNEYEQQLDQLKAENEQLKEELSAIQHNCNREGCRYYDDNTFKVFYECKAQKALQLSANSVTTKYCDLLKTLTEIKEIAEVHKKDESVWNPYRQLDKILQKISEVEND